jgi:sec-independent protein translocase protein TatB
MFDITSSKLFLLAIVALLVIGPKDFPVLLRTIGKYLGIIRGHAREFRAQFDEAMRETELAQLKKDMENIAQETEASLHATGREVEQTLSDAGKTMEASLEHPVENPVENTVEDPLAPVEIPPMPVPPEQAAEGVANLDGVPAAVPEPTPASATAPVPAAQATVALEESSAPAPSGETAIAPPAAPAGSLAPAQAAERTGA